MTRRRTLLYLLPFALLFADFLGPVAALQKSFIAADFSVQHWPWAEYFYNSLRAGQFPFWTDAMTAGFPLVAEGQIAAFYGPHRLLYALLPFWPAYSWSVCLHFLAGSLGFYAYARSLRLSRASAGFSALIYAFGSAYAGCYYNTGSLRTLAWLPFLLWSIEKMLTRHSGSVRRSSSGGPTDWNARIGRGALVALAVGQMWNAGFAQIAVYAFGYAFCMALLNVRKRGGAESAAVYGGAVVVGTLLAAPQIVLTCELIGQSVRQGESIAFALWGSMPPSGPVSLLFPEWGNIQRVSLYAGVPALFAVLAFLVLPPACRQAGARPRRRDWRHAILFLFFLLLSLGKFNPLYAALIKGLSLTFLRNPSKFLFFAGASLAIVAGQGLDSFLLALKRGKAGRLIAPAAVLAGAAAALPGACRFAWAMLRPAWEKLSARLVATVLAEKGATARPSAEYETFLNSFYDRLGALFSYAQAHTLASVLLAIACAALIAVAAKRKISRSVFLALFFALAVADFHHYGWNLGTGFIGNTDRISRVRPDERIRFLQNAVSADPGSIAEFDVEPADEFLPPNRPMAYGLSHAGGYAPLLLKNYYDLTHDLGIVDGSLGRAAFSEDIWKANRGVLDLIGVQHLASDAKLSWAEFRETGRSGNTVFYRNLQVLPPAAAWTHAKAIPDAAERLHFMKSSEYDPRALAVVERDPGLPADPDPSVFSNAEVDRWIPGRLQAIYTLPAPGIGWARIAAYPGWKLWIDGKPQPWFRVNHAFVGFRLESGAHRVELDYVPSRYRAALAVSALATLLVLVAAFRFFFKAKPL